jgi:hypothetical protein
VTFFKSSRNRAGLRFRDKQGDRSPWAAFLCLAAILAQVVLPIAHTSHLLLQHPFADPLTGSLEGRALAKTPGLTSENQTPSRDSRHDPESCLVCQTLMHSSAFIVPFNLLNSSPPPELGGLLSALSDTNVSKCALAGCGARAPPLYIV